VRLIPPWSWKERSTWMEANPGIASVYLGCGSAAVLSVMIALEVGVMGALGWFVVLAPVMSYLTWRQLTRDGVEGYGSEWAGDGPPERAEDPAPAQRTGRSVRGPARLFRGVVDRLSRLPPAVLVMCIIGGVGGTIFSVIDADGRASAAVLLGVPWNIGLVVLFAMALRRRHGEDDD
jgi:hypothetical protein